MINVMSILSIFFVIVLVVDYFTISKLRKENEFLRDSIKELIELEKNKNG